MAISEINHSLKKEERNKIKELELYQVIDFMFTNDKILNDWWFKKEKYKGLVYSFYNKGIYKPSDMTKIIYLSYYYKLKNDTINTNKIILLLNKEKNTCEKCMEFDSINTHQALQYYNKYALNDTINIAFPIVINSQDEYSTFEYESPFDNWKINSSNTLMLKGIINNKHRINNALIEFKVKVIDFNKNHIIYFTKELKKNDLINVNLRRVKIFD